MLRKLWFKIKCFFKDSEVVFWARAQYYGGMLLLMFEVVFIEVLPMIDMSVFFTTSRAVALWSIFSGVLTEVLRRRRAKRDSLGNLE